MRTLITSGRDLRGRQVAVLVDGARLAAVSADPAGTALAEPADRVLDATGLMLTPAFVDAHVHLTQTGLMSTGADLRGAASLAEALDIVAAAGAGTVLGAGWDEHGWPERRPPSAAELDRAAAGAVVSLGRVDGHSSVVSSAALAAWPQLGGLAGFDGSGWLRLAANAEARRLAFAALSPDRRRAAGRAALDAAAAAGIGCVHEMASPLISGESDLTDLLAAEHPVEVIGYWGELDAAGTAVRLGAAGAAGDLNCDGSVGSRTAWFARPYAGTSTCGAPALDAERIARHVLDCTARGVQAGFHAIGDAAVDAVLAGVERAGAVDPAVRRAGHRIEHAELVTDPHRMAATGLTASVQPAFDAAWGGPAGMYADRLGAERALRMNDLAALAAAGVPLAFGSDSPVTPFDPWGAIRAAVHPSGGGPGLSLAAAFAAHTTGGWRAARRAGGTLTPGAPATLALWSVPDGVTVAPGASLPQCRGTVVAGRVAFDGGVL